MLQYLRYGVAVANARKVGARAGQLLSFLKENVQLNYDDVHVLGFSLGGQLVAFIGQELNGVLPRITGLDPAGTLTNINYYQSLFLIKVSFYAFKFEFWTFKLGVRKVHFSHLANICNILREFGCI